MGIYEDLKEQESLVICSHSDADGIYSASLISTIFGVETVYFPKTFGDYSVAIKEVREQGEIVEKKLSTDLALDLGPPIEPDSFRGIIIDHHPQTGKYKEESNKERIYTGNIPTTALVYQLLKEHIPSEKLWYVAGGCVGDGQPEKIPPELWEVFPELLETGGNIYKSRYKFKEYPYPVYKQLSSPVNAMCRMGNPLTAYKIVQRCKTPFDLINNSALKNDKESIKDEINSIAKEGLQEINIRHYASVVTFESNKKVASRICSSLGNMNNNKTWIVINTKGKRMSIRGDLASYIGSKLKEHNISCGGHAGFWGGELTEEQSSQDIIDILREELV